MSEDGFEECSLIPTLSGQNRACTLCHEEEFFFDDKINKDDPEENQMRGFVGDGKRLVFKGKSSKTHWIHKGFFFLLLLLDFLLF